MQTNFNSGDKSLLVKLPLKAKIKILLYSIMALTGLIFLCLLICIPLYVLNVHGKILTACTVVLSFCVVILYQKLQDKYIESIMFSRKFEKFVDSGGMIFLRSKSSRAKQCGYFVIRPTEGRFSIRNDPAFSRSWMIAETGMGWRRFGWPIQGDSEIESSQIIHSGVSSC